MKSPNSVPKLIEKEKKINSLSDFCKSRSHLKLHIDADLRCRLYFKLAVCFFLLLCSAVRRRLINVDMSRNEMKLMQSSGDYAIWVPHSTTFQLIRISIELSSLKFTLGWPGDKQGNSKCTKSQKIKQFHRYRRRVILHKQVNSKRINERNESKHVLWIFANTRTPFFKKK